MTDIPDSSREDRVLNLMRSGDTASLIAVYRDEADRLEALRDIDAACFYLTQAYVFALEAGDLEADSLHARLKAYGREA